MNFRKMIALAVLLAGVVLYITKIEIADDELKHVQERPFEKLAPQSVEEVQITNSTGSFVLANKAPKIEATVPAQGDVSLSEDEASQWEVRGVVDSELDRGTINTLLSAIRNLKLENKISDEDIDKDLGVYGLSSPELSVSLKASGILRSFQFGKMNEYVRTRYLKDVSDSAIYLVANDIFASASKAPNDFRTRVPLGVLRGEVTKLTIKAPSGTVVIERSGDSWKLVSPGPFSASDVAVSGVIRELKNTRVSGFVDDATGREVSYGLNAPFVQAVIESKRDSSVTTSEVAFGKIEETKDGKVSPRYFMRIGGKRPIYELAGDPSSRIVKEVSALREKQLVQLDVDKIHELTITVPDREDFTLIRSENEWKVNGKDSDLPFVQELLQSVSRLEAVDFPNHNEDFGFNVPVGKIIARSKTEGAAQVAKTVVIGKQSDSPTKGFFAIVEGSDEPFIISPESFKKITPRLEALLKSEPPTPGPGSQVDAPAEGH